MGCWQETCLITRVPIYPGDEVAMVVVAKDKERNLIHYFEYLNAFRGYPKVIERIEFGRYNYYGWLDELEGEASKDYSNRPEPYERSVFVLKDVWDEIQDLDTKGNWTEAYLEKAKKEADKILQNKESRDKLTQWMKVMWFCQELRIDPAGGLLYKGSQTDNSKLYKKLIDIQKKCYTNWKKMKSENS